MPELTEKRVWQALEGVTDPELPVSIVDMGMVYDVSIEETNTVTVDITFTSIGCPGMEMIFDDIRAAIGEIEGVGGVEISVVWSPPWTKARLTERGRTLLRASGLSL